MSVLPSVIVPAPPALLHSVLRRCRHPETARRRNWAATLVIVALAMVVLTMAEAEPALAAIEFKGPIQWQDWDAGLKQATAKGKPILVLMHTDACPKCTLLGHVFNNNKDVQKLAKSMVLVHIDGGRAPMPLMQRFARFGSYVPKIVFLKADGTPMDQITSGNGNFPYYFQPSRPEGLLSAMQRAVETQATLAQKAPPTKGSLRPAGRAAKQCVAGSAGC